MVSVPLNANEDQRNAEPTHGAPSPEAPRGAEPSAPAHVAENGGATLAAERSAPLYVLPPDGIHLADVERSFVEQALDRAAGNQSQAARMLGITRFALRNRIKRYHLRDRLMRDRA